MARSSQMRLVYRCTPLSADDTVLAAIRAAAAGSAKDRDAQVADRFRTLRRSGPTCRTARGGGFTLLEVLVMLVIVGLLMATLTQGVLIGLRSRAIASSMDSGASDLEATARLLRQLIGRASPGDPSLREAAFVGTAHSAAFVTTLPDGFGNTTTREADVSVAVGAAHRLELRWRPHYRRWIVAPPPPATAALLDGIERLDLSFWQPAGGLPGRWVSTWAAPDPPGLVRLRFVFPPGDRRHWADLIVAPMRSYPQP